MDSIILYVLVGIVIAGLAGKGLGISITFGNINIGNRDNSDKTKQ